jgi:ergothioneine biosynthesis protein EgtB
MDAASRNDRSQVAQLESWVDRFLHTRQDSLALTAALQIEDYGVQPMDDASPPKWHLAHTTWFYETFVVKPWNSAYQPDNPEFEYMFNSYYNGVGTPFPRTKRGSLSRPTVQEVLDYRARVEDQVVKLLDGGCDDELLTRVELGIHHERQHQELIVTDLKFNLGNNPLYPAYCENLVSAESPVELAYVAFAGGLFQVGAPDEGFAFDNERPVHKVHLEGFQLANRLVTNGEYLEFINDHGYERPELWLAEGWDHIDKAGWRAPLYWVCRDGDWFEYQLGGLAQLEAHLPAVHISAHEAVAYATWADARLPTEFEWEVAAAGVEVSGNFSESQRYHPTGQSGESKARIHQLYGDAWEWTSSSYGPYPGYKTLPGTLGEYNGKFMSSQLVLRGGSCATAQSHIRASYRNFFYPPDRWQFSGLRLARNGNG